MTSSNLHLHHSQVDQVWIDYNGHMRDAFYGLVFSEAIDAFMDAVGIDQSYRQHSGGTIFTVEDHKFYVDECKLGDELVVESRILDHDAKRWHLGQVLKRAQDGAVVCVCESMLLHVVQSPGQATKTAPMADEIQAKVAAFECSAEQLEQLSWRSGKIGIRRKG